MQSGRSMVELLGVIAIISMLTIGALTGWPQMRKNMRVSKTQNEIALIAQEINSITYWFSSYPDGIDDMSVLCENEVFPSGCKPDNTAENPFGGVYVVAVSEADGTLTIKATNLPNKDVCDEIKNYEFHGLYEEPNCDEDSGKTVTVKFGASPETTSR